MRSVKPIVTLAVLLLVSGCNSTRELSREIRGEEQELSISFRIADNLLFLQNMTVGGRDGNFIVATALADTILDESFEHTLVDGEIHALIRETETVRISPELYDLGGDLDGLIGSDVLAPAITIDYFNETVSIRPTIAFEDADLEHSFVGRPSLPVSIGTRDIEAWIDTANPDSLHVPAEWIDADPGAIGERMRGHVSLGPIDLGEIDFLLIERGPARIGNRVLAQFLIGIDYRDRRAFLWQMPVSAQ